MPEESIQELYQRIVNLLASLISSSGDFGRADMDELSMLTQASQSILPERFVKIVSEADQNFPSTHKSRDELRERLERVLFVSKSIPEPASHSNGSALLPTFTLPKKDKDRVVKLCGDMRKIVFASVDFDEPHKKRLLNRIAAMEKQVLSKTGLFDVILGGVSDIGETIGKFGKDIKPLTDRMNEVAQITRQGTKEYDQIPAPEEIKRLPKPDDADEN